MTRNLVLLLLLLLTFPSIVQAFTNCTSNADCQIGYVCSIIDASSVPVCVDGGLAACKSYCENDVAYQTGYSTTSGCFIAGQYECSYGCSPTGPDCRSQPATKECTLDEDCIGNVCEAGYERIRICADGSCVPGETVAYCPEGCASLTSCPSSKVDNCAGVTCPDKCESGTMNSNGSCNSGTGHCDYLISQCPQGCAPDGLGCKGAMNAELFYSDEKGKRVPIKFARVETWSSNQGHILARGKFVTDENGKFTWEDAKAFASGNLVSGTVYLDDSRGGLYVSDPIAESSPIGIVFADMVSASDPSLVDFQFDFATFKNRELAGDAKIYALAQMAVNFKEDGLKFTPSVKERVIASANGGNWHQEEVYADTTASPTGISLLPASSDFYNRYIADTIFHEYCHHIQGEVQNAPRTPAGSDHGGYFANPDSEYGLIEGWAEFCALEVKRYQKIDRYAQYRLRGVLINLELDYKMDDKFFRPEVNKSPLMLEEMGIASLLVDLRDSTSDYGGLDDDFVSLPTSTIWDAFHKKRDFNDGQGLRDVHTLHDFYSALKEETTGYAYLSEPYMKESNLTNLDAVFVKHGAFQDLNNNGRWDNGEQAGYSGKGAALRSDLEAENGTELSVGITDQDGNPLNEGVLLHVDVRFEGNDSYLSYSYDVPLSEGKIAVPVPPREYDATITITAQQAGTGVQALNSFTITTQEAFDRMDPDKPLGNYSAIVPISSVVACAKDYECGYLEAGDKCLSGACVKSGTVAPNPPGPEPGPEPVPEPECLPAVFILAIALGTVFVAAKN